MQFLAKKNVKNSVQKQRSKRLVCIFATDYSCWHCPERLPQASTASGSATATPSSVPRQPRQVHTLRKGGNVVHYIGKAFTRRSVLDESNLANSFYQSLEHSNGRCPRVWFIRPITTLSARIVSFRAHLLFYIRSVYGKDFHIGVGSDVVGSTLIGSWKSLSVWNGQQDDSTLFFCRNLTDFCLEKS